MQRWDEEQAKKKITTEGLYAAGYFHSEDEGETHSGNNVFSLSPPSPHTAVFLLLLFFFVAGVGRGAEVFFVTLNSLAISFPKRGRTTETRCTRPACKSELLAFLG